jgi:predicted nucleic acid-binding protein
VSGEVLLDTGALVGLLDRSQSVHQECVDFFQHCSSAIVSTEAVLAEAAHLLSDVRGGRIACIDFFLKGGAVLVPSTEISLKRCRDLIEKYTDLPMDLADATLVVLAEELNANTVFTFDKDFRVYRIHGRRAFDIVPRLRQAKK